MSQAVTHKKIANKKVHQQKEKSTRLIFMPLMLLLGGIPLVTRLKILEMPEAAARAYKQASNPDFFAYYKASLILVIAFCMLVIVFFTMTKEVINKYKNLLIYIGAGGVFLIFTLLSALFSPYKQVALWGVPGRMEGALVITAYLIMTCYTIYALREAEHYRYIIYGLTVLVVITTFLGIFEYAGQNLLSSTRFGKNLLFPAEYAQYQDQLQLSYDKGKVYGTMYHYNYMGSFGALMVPLFTTLALFIKGKKEKICFGILALCSLFLLFGSTSRGGLIGVATAIVLGVIVFAKTIVKRWKMTVPVILALGIMIIGLNAATGGTIFERIPTLIKDIGISFSSKGEDFDYKDYLPLRDITTAEGKTILTTQTDALTIAKVEEGIKLYDKQNQEVAYTDQGEALAINDERFQNLRLHKIYDNANNWAAFILNIDGQDTLVFKIDDTEGIYLINSFTQQKEEVAYPPTFGFEGKERLGSARGYIWSRSIPMLKDTWFIGHGPDTYALDFPQNDYLGKYYAYETPNMIVDKPHNLYLQIGINEGVIALVAFLVLVLAYIVQSIRIYAFKGHYENRQVIGIATMLSIIGYLGAGIFNDSIVAVAPIFWILLGAGIAINYINNPHIVRKLG